MTLYGISPIRLEWNFINGFIFHLFDLEADILGKSINSSLFAIHVGINDKWYVSFVCVHLFFFKFTPYDDSPILTEQE
jgi:hypothetical protein